MKKRRVRWGRVVAVIAVPLLIIGGIATADMWESDTKLIEYHKEVVAGETLWDICAEIATDKEDLNRLVWQAMKDNHIENPATLQPGQIVIVRVQEARTSK